MGLAQQGGNLPKTFPGELWFLVGRVKGIAGPSVAKISNAAYRGYTISRTGAGVYVITLGKKCVDFCGGAFTVMSSATKLVARISAYSISAGTITVTVSVADTGTATDLGTSDELWFNVGLAMSGQS